MFQRNFRDANISDADRCFAIETSAYKGDEAATHTKISKRIETYPQGFLILEVDGKVAGFINCGCAHEVEMSDEDFKELIGHDPMPQMSSLCLSWSIPRRKVKAIHGR